MIHYIMPLVGLAFGALAAYHWQWMSPFERFVLIAFATVCLIVGVVIERATGSRRR